MSRGLKDGYLRYRGGQWIDCDGDPVEIEQVVHAQWKLRGGLFRCTNCDAKALWSRNGGTNLYSREYEQVTAQRCHVCGAHMDEEVAK